MTSLPAAPVGSNSVLGHCATHNASTTDARGAAVSQVANKQHAGSLICSEWTCDCDSALFRIVSLKVFRIRSRDDEPLSAEPCPATL